MGWLLRPPLARLLLALVLHFQEAWRYAMNTNTADRTTAKTSAARLRNSMEDLANQLRSEINRVTDPRAQALFETSAEALRGLIKAFEDYDEGRETAFRA